MSDWRPEHEVELAAMMAGGAYERTLIESALGPYLTRIGERIMQQYWQGSETIDDVLGRIKKLEQPESPNAAALQTSLDDLEKLVRAQYNGAELESLLATLGRKG